MQQQRAAVVIMQTDDPGYGWYGLGNCADELGYGYPTHRAALEAAEAHFGTLYECGCGSDLCRTYANVPTK